mmetsp:Transcript_8337/g.27186  ORF Transcript_8337/g.27186 Transcript_8337/m.27186 type:complete len:211 (-) Transcript_8337:1358-1990(-)
MHGPRPGRPQKGGRQGGELLCRGPLPLAARARRHPSGAGYRRLWNDGERRPRVQLPLLGRLRPPLRHRLVAGPRRHLLRQAAQRHEAPHAAGRVWAPLRARLRGCLWRLRHRQLHLPLRLQPRRVWQGDRVRLWPRLTVRGHLHRRLHRLGLHGRGRHALGGLHRHRAGLLRLSRPPRWHRLRLPQLPSRARCLSWLPARRQERHPRGHE